RNKPECPFYVAKFGGQKISLLSLAFWALLSDSSLLCLQVVKAVPEPPHTVLEKSSHEVELVLSAQVDYAKFKLDTVEVQLKQTELFQTEISTFQMSNTGNVALKYCWEGNLEEEIPSKSSGKPFLSTLTRKSLALGGAQATSVGS
ncbi:hydrocephalus-inducing protein-like, partial [Corapipo altera]|uniref:hydrocephalus-inducing protein-like n=1 Tax=Corapipo altera TaxID=415028 RepID=UPI000FD68BBB